jgi:hypothetical protein
LCARLIRRKRHGEVIAERVDDDDERAVEAAAVPAAGRRGAQLAGVVEGDGWCGTFGLVGQDEAGEEEAVREEVEAEEVQRPVPSDSSGAVGHTDINTASHAISHACLALKARSRRRWMAASRALVMAGPGAAF